VEWALEKENSDGNAQKANVALVEAWRHSKQLLGDICFLVVCGTVSVGCKRVHESGHGITKIVERHVGEIRTTPAHLLLEQAKGDEGA